MFTGLVQSMGHVRLLRDLPPGVRLVLDIAGEVGQGIEIGESFAINGCCLTVVEAGDEGVAFDAGAETLSRTNLGKLKTGDFVNLERSLRVGDRLGGHFVTGHIDAVGQLDQREDDVEWSTFWFSVPPELTTQMVSKGSVGVDGVSLTLVDVEKNRFSVALIPHTLRVTTLGRLNLGDPVNIETDVLAKYAQKLAIPEFD